ncbi:MAG: helix-turn-helix domain-containing protein [Rhodopila sp.]
MSYQAVEWALEIPRLRAPVKLVLVALAERADAQGGNCHPGLSELTRRASTSRRRVLEAIRQLEEIGAITVVRSVKRNGREREVNHYTLAVGREIVVPPAVAAKFSKKGTTVVPKWNQDSSLGGTGTATEPSS